MQVTSLLLLAATTAIATAQSSGIYNYSYVYICIAHSELCNAECSNGQLRESNSTLSLLEYCYNGEWRQICSRDSQWDTDMSVAACTELGYSDSGKSTIYSYIDINWFFILEITAISSVS